MRNKWLLITLISLAVVAVAALSLNALFTVAEVEVVSNAFSEQGREDADKCARLFDRYRGKNLCFFKTSRPARDASDLPYVEVTSVAKKWPNKLVVTLTERSETFAAEFGGTYYAFDRSGLVLRAGEGANFNNADEHPNVLVGAAVASAEVGKKIAFSSEDEERVFYAVADKFDDIRNEVGSIDFVGEVVRYVYIRMQTGVVIALDTEEADVGDKLGRAMEAYDAQEEYKKLSGFIVESGKTDFLWTEKDPSGGSSETD